MKKPHTLPALLLALGLFAGSAQALDFGTAIGGGVGAVAGAVIGDSVGGRSGAIVGSGVGGAVGAAVGQSLDGPHYYPVHGGHRHFHAPPRVVEYRYYPYPVHVRPYGHAWGHDKHRHHHRRHHHHRHGWHR